MVSALTKWPKRLIVLVFIIIVFEYFLFEFNIKSKLMVVISNRNFSMATMKIVSSLDRESTKDSMVPSENSSVKIININSIKNTSKKLMESTTKLMEENPVAVTSLNQKVQLENKGDTELGKPNCFYNSTSSRAGRVSVNLSPEKMETIENSFASTLTPGGRYAPPDCKSEQRIAVIIPYRDREEHLKVFLRHMHPFLQRQKLEYAIYVIEMDKDLKFNRAILMNIGFIEALNLHNYTCFVFHDVDLLPEDNRIPYSCTNMPQHLSVAVDKFNYRLPYETIFGGACSIKTEHFRKINGMSNMFFGWGGEDDDLSKRVLLSGLRIVRPSIAVARYKMIKHSRDQDQNPQRNCLLKTIRTRQSRDGLSNIKYSVKHLELRPLYTWVLVAVKETEQLQSDDYLFTIYKQCAGLNVLKKNPLVQ